MATSSSLSLSPMPECWRKLPPFAITDIGRASSLTLSHPGGASFDEEEISNFLPKLPVTLEQVTLSYFLSLFSSGCIYIFGYNSPEHAYSCNVTHKTSLVLHCPLTTNLESMREK
jgi:hypothetical protein